MIKYSSIIACLLVILFISCDGRHRKYEKNYDALNHEYIVNTDNSVIYIPETYTEIQTDTLLSTDFNVQIKYYALMDSAIKQELKENKTEYHRNFESEVVVFKKDKLIYDSIIDKSLFYNPNEAQFWDKAILQYVWLDEIESDKHQIRINYTFLVPETQLHKSFMLDINVDGAQKITQIETS